MGIPGQYTHERISAFSRLLRRRTEGIAANYRRRLGPEPDVRGKLAALAELRTAEGYMARLEELPEGGYLLIEDHCPLRRGDCLSGVLQR